MRILLATDFSGHTEKARALVAGLALPPSSTVRAVHAIEPMTNPTALGPVPIIDLTEEAARELHAELEKFVLPLRSPERNVEIVLPFGRAADVIVDEAERLGADLIVIGSRGRGGIATMLLGSVSAEVIDRALCPVLVARRRTLTRILLAEDGSPSAALGAALLADLPPLRALPVRVISVVDAPFPWAIADDPLVPSAAMEAYYEVLPELRAQQEKLARERAETLGAVGVSATFETREGAAAAEIINAAAEDGSDLIVIGTRGRTGLTRLVLGSVARGVLLHAGCSVLVAHPRTKGEMVAYRRDAERVAVGR